MLVSRAVSRRLAAITAATACAITLVPAAANAGPDDGKIVTTRTHVDSPKTFFRDGTFRLFNEHPSYNQTCTGENTLLEDGMCLAPVDGTVIYVGKGWGSREGTGQQYQFALPNSASLAELGTPGDIWYLSPALPQGNRDPNWVGFGSDINIPTDTFRDGNFELEILSVDGPGRVEMFNYPTFDYPNDISRLLSSSNPTYRSIPLLPGSHTHNQTVFERPGRYEITYRTVARSTDGSIISSQPSTQVWQVGGQPPADTATPSPRERYDAARSGEISGLGYTFSTAPKTDVAKDGDKNLTTIRFDAGDPAISGTVTLFVNGYFLTDLPVENGAATWDELLGSADSELQTVFTPSSESGVRWISPTIQHKPGASNSVWSVWDGAGSWPQPIATPANTALSTDNYTPTSNHFTATLSPTDNPKVSKVDIHFDDPNIRGHLAGGLYEDGSTGALVNFKEGVANGNGTGHISYLSYYDGTQVKLSFLPHANMNMRGFTFNLPEKYSREKTITTSGNFTISEAGPADLEVIGDGNTEPDQAKPSAPATPKTPDSASKIDICLAPQLADKLLLTDGHVDIQASLNDGKLGISLKDETGLHAKQTVERRLDEVGFVVPDNTRTVREGDLLLDSDLDFLGAAGSAFYNLPQSQLQGTVWPGYNTQLIDYDQLTGSVDLHLEPVSIPEGSNYGVFSQNLGMNFVQLNSAAADYAIEVDFATHAHTNWAFTKPGTYILDAYYSATTADGSKLESEHQQLVIAVGNGAQKPCSANGTNQPDNLLPKLPQSSPSATEPLMDQIKHSDQQSPSTTAGPNRGTENQQSSVIHPDSRIDQKPSKLPATGI